MARVLGRIRLSVVTDATTSPERQMETIEAGAKRRGDTVIEWVYDPDFSRSVSPFDAPALGPWLSDPLKRAQWDVIASSRVDRLGAGWKLGDLFGWIISHGKDLISEDVGFSLRSKFGQTVYTLYADLAMNEWDAIRSRSVDSQDKLRRLGRWRGGSPAYWLKPAPSGAGWTLVLDPYPADVTRRIIREYLAGRPVKRICDDLNDEGVLAPTDYRRFRAMALAESQGREYTGKPVEGTRWLFGTIEEFMANRSLLGHAVHDDQTVYDADGKPVVAAEALVTPAEFEQIRAETARRKALRLPRRDAGAGALLGIAVCRECGHRLYLNRQTNPKGTPYVYYRFPCGHGGRIRAEVLEDVVHEEFINAVGRYPRLDPVYVPAEDHSVELEQAQAAYEELAARYSATESTTARKALDRQLSALEGRMATLEALPRTEARVEYQETGETYAAAWARMDDQERRQLMLDTGVEARTRKVRATGEPWVSLAFRSGFLRRLGVDDGDWALYTGNVPEHLIPEGEEPEDDWGEHGEAKL